MPNIVAMSIYMGKMHYTYQELTLESMRWNHPIVDYVLLDIVEHEGSKEVERTKAIAKRMKIPNFEIKEVTIKELTYRVRDVLNISVPFNKSWFYKLCEYKPTLALLFPEIVKRQLPNGQLKYGYWGYVDMDMIWGNVSRFAHLFQGNYPFVFTDWFHSNGAAAFLVNEPWTWSLFATDPMFILLLKNFTYHNLDENGQFHDVVDGGDHSITSIMKRYIDQHPGRQMNIGKNSHDMMWIDQNAAIGK